MLFAVVFSVKISTMENGASFTELDTSENISEKIRSGLYKISNKRKGRSEVWHTFGEIEKEDGTVVSQVVFCRSCHGILKFNGKQTSNLNRHKCYLMKKKITPLKKMKHEENESADEESEECTVEPIAEVKISKPPEPKRSKSFSVHQISNSNLNSSQARPERSSLPVIDKGAKLDDPRVNAAYDILKATVAKNDDCSLYGEHVATKIRQYSDRTRSIVQHHINNILFEADIGKFEIQGDPLNSPAESNGSEKSVDFGYTTGFLHKNKTKKNKNKK